MARAAKGGADQQQAPAPAAAPAAPAPSGDQQQAPAPAAAPAAPEAKPSKKAVGDVKVIVQVAISGTRNGLPWPKPGEEFKLPADEAADYIALEYVRAVESTK